MFRDRFESYKYLVLFNFDDGDKTNEVIYCYSLKKQFLAAHITTNYILGKVYIRGKQ